MNVTEAFKFDNISVTTAAFTVRGGRYILSAVATWSAGSVQLQMLAEDGVTWIAPWTIAGAANNFTANATATLDLVPGQYRLAVTTATAVYASLCSVPI